MPTKRDLLGQLTRDELLAVLDEHGLPVATVAEYLRRSEVRLARSEVRTDADLQEVARLRTASATATPARITLPREEVALIARLRRRVGAKTNVAVVRRALHLLEETTDRAALRKAYADASLAARGVLEAELADLDHLSAEGLDD